MNFTADGNHLVVESMDSVGQTPSIGMIYLLDVSTLEIATSYSTQDDLLYGGFAVDPMGSRIATFGCGGAVIRDVRSGEPYVATERMGFDHACYSPDGKKLILSRDGNSLFTLDTLTGSLMEGIEHDLLTTSICPVADDVYLITAVDQGGAGMWFFTLDDKGIMRDAPEDFGQVVFPGDSLFATFSTYTQKICAVDNLINIFSYPGAHWQASFNSRGEFVYPEEHVEPRWCEGYWSNPVFLGESGILAVKSPHGLLFLDLNSNQLLDIQEEQSLRMMLAYHDGNKLLASVGSDGKCIVRQISITR
ncbi:WD40 repeat domain-containing protein [bacterium]|nr:MAG: WD40 repeat domain-containing protein [bacterium]